MIVARDLSKSYGSIRALEAVTATIPQGGVTALVGPNGAGKSTLLKLCIGFERPTSGSIEIGGVNPLRNRARALALIGFVAQSPVLYRDLSVAEHVKLAEILRPGFDPHYTRRRLAALAIAPGVKSGALSGGEAAQVSLALALGTRAPLLLLDEPLASLDPLARREFLGVVAVAAKDEGVTVVLSSHVLSEVGDVADRILLLSGGGVLLDDSIDAAVRVHRVIAEQADRSRGRFIASFPGLGGRTHALIGTSESVGRAPTLEEIVVGYLAWARRDDERVKEPEAAT